MKEPSPIIYLSVPFKDKEAVKRRGAFWDSEKKKWYCFNNFKSIYAVKRWLPAKLKQHYNKPTTSILPASTPHSKQFLKEAKRKRKEERKLQAKIESPKTIKSGLQGPEVDSWNQRLEELGIKI